ncbi:MAG: DoxX family protein [Rhodothermales bacterium]
MKVLTTTVARILFAVPFGMFGIMHFVFGSDMAGMVPSFIPGGVFWVYLVGVALLAACISILIGKWTQKACLLLALLLMIFVLTIHLPGALDEATRQMAMSSMLKDLGLAGGALILAGISEDT